MPADRFKSLNQVFHLLLFTEDNLQLHNSIPKHLKTQTNTHLVACIQLENAAADGVNVRLRSSKQPVPRRTVWQRYLQQQPTTQTMQHYAGYHTWQDKLTLETVWVNLYTQNCFDGHFPALCGLTRHLKKKLNLWNSMNDVLAPRMSKEHCHSSEAVNKFTKKICKIHNPLNICSNYRVHRTAGL